MWQRLVATDGNKNFWACPNGHSDPSREGDRVRVLTGSGLTRFQRKEPCVTCGLLMRLVTRTAVLFRNTWD